MPKLPPITIQKFRGDILQWPAFWDIFRSTIDENVAIPPVSKLTYLLSFLEGPSLQAVEGIAPTDANYSVVKDILKRKFGRKQDVIIAYFQDMFNLPPARDSGVSLCTTITKLDSLIRQLAAQGVDESKYTDALISLILLKIPTDIRTELERQRGDQDWKLESLRKNLDNEIRAREVRFKPQGAINTPRQQANWPPPTTDSLAVPNQATQKPPCAFCKSQVHYSDQCNKFGSTEARKSQLGNRCFVCLRPGHGAKNCQRTKPCYYCRQVGQHHSSLCPKQFGAHALTTPSDLQNESPDTVSSLATPSRLATTLMPVATSSVRNPNSPELQVIANMVLDPASGRSYISQRLANALKLTPSGSSVLSYSFFGAEQPKTRTVNLVSVEAETIDNTWESITLAVVPVITTPMTMLPINANDYEVVSTLRLSRHLSEQSELIQPDILIGLDFYYLLASGKRIDLSAGLVLIHSRFGWIPTGRIPDATDSSSCLCAHTLAIPASDPLADTVERFWTLDSIGVTDCGQTSDDAAALESFRKSVVIDKGRYSVSWPWKSPRPTLPSNFGIAIGRLRSLLRSLCQKPTLLQQYNKVIQDQLERGMIEEVPQAHQEVNTNPVHYMPHHGVFKQDNTTTKLRVVFDASAKENKFSPSLNDCLLRGPVMIQDLVGIVLRFRMHPIVMVADVEKAFLQIGLHSADRDACRFLWLKDVRKPSTEDGNLMILRWARTPFGVISSPFLLAATVAHHIKQFNSKFAASILRNLYVDNLLHGCMDVVQGTDFYAESKRMFSEASMNLRGWTSNSSQLRNCFPVEDRNSEKEVKMLGLCWNTYSDSISIQKQPDFLLHQNKLTKRTILQVMSSVFDPLGLFSPVLVPIKTGIQKMWKEKITWDSEIQSRSPDWISLLQQLHHIPQILIPRYICPGTNPQVHVFCDASARAYAAGVYIRSETPSGIQSHLVISKARLAPLKQITLPRLLQQ